MKHFSSSYNAQSLSRVTHLHTVLFHRFVPPLDEVSISSLLLSLQPVELPANSVHHRFTRREREEYRGRYVYVCLYVGEGMPRVSAACSLCFLFGLFACVSIVGVGPFLVNLFWLFKISNDLFLYLCVSLDEVSRCHIHSIASFSKSIILTAGMNQQAQVLKHRSPDPTHNNRLNRNGCMSDSQLMSHENPSVGDSHSSQLLEGVHSVQSHTTGLRLWS